MPEHQNIEYKSSWHDELLRKIYGFPTEKLCFMSLKFQKQKLTRHET